MMEMERREESKRMHIEKRVSLYIPGKKKAYQGVTRNMSDAGICAGFKKLPKDGEDVLLHVFWQEDKPPIEQAARLVWTSPAMPDGIARVGLRLKDEPMGRSAAEPIETEATPESPRIEVPTTSEKVPETAAPVESVRNIPSKPVIEQGAEVRLLVGGVAIETIAASIGDIQEDNTVHVVLEIVDPAFGGAVSPAQADGIPEEQDWTPHPFRDAWRSSQKFLGPAAALTVRIARVLFRAAAKITRPLLRRFQSKFLKKLST